MERPIFLLLGGNKLNYGLVDKFHKKKWDVFIIDWNEHPQMTGDKHYPIDVKKPELIMGALKRDGVFDRVKLAYTSIDLATRSVASIMREKGCHTISDTGLEYASSKHKMTEKWAEAGLLNRLSAKYDSYSDEIVKINRKMKIIIKPDNSASSRGITILDKDSNSQMLEKAYLKAYEEASNHLVVVEEFVEGTEFTVDMIGDDYGNVCVYGISRKTHTNNTVNNRIAVKLHYNAIPEELQLKIADIGIKCYKALGFSASLGHLEIILKKDGTLSPVEIGARSSGYIVSDLADIVSGTDCMDELQRVYNGEKLTNGLHPQTDRSSVFFFYDFPVGASIIHSCSILDFCDSSISSRHYDRSNIIEGRSFETIDSDNARWGYEILEGPKSILTVDYLKNMEVKMLNYMFGGNYVI